MWLLLSDPVHIPMPVFPGDQRELVALLFSRNVAVYLVSGGFSQLIEPVAEALGIPKDNIYANQILFNEKGEFSI